jgi:DNA sulfur modification protein DndC
MTKQKSNLSSQYSAFTETGFKETVEFLKEEIREFYLEDEIPWIIGYSGGKDSTAVLQLIWLAVYSLPKAKLKKPIYVISTDTLVENPVVATWVTKSLTCMGEESEKNNLPFKPNRLTPEVLDSFWVNLIGKGYPAPRPKFRWCTDRLKIKPSNKFIRDIVSKHGETIVVLGTRSAESASRAATMAKHAEKKIRDRLTPNSTLPNSLIYSPIENWSNDDVWVFLMQTPNPWNFTNKDLLTMYQGASEDGECPLVIDTTTPSCGDSRFGCWVCTLVEKDRSMSAMITNDEEKEWMLPLLKFRDELDVKNDREFREKNRMTGLIQFHNGNYVPGPYKQKFRDLWLKKLLKAQYLIQTKGPDYVKDLELISIAELEEIRRIWVIDKHELEDNLPKIYQEVLGREYPGAPLDDNLIFGDDEIELLKKVTGEKDQLFELIRELINVERQYQTMSRRTGLQDALEQAFKKNLFSNKDEAVKIAFDRYNQKKEILNKVDQLTSESSDFIRPIQQGQLFPDSNDN